MRSRTSSSLNVGYEDAQNTTLLNPFAAIPFGFGPRMCIGRRFAELEVQVLVVKLLQKFKIEYHHEPVGIATPFLVKPDREIKMKFSPRI